MIPVFLCVEALWEGSTEEGRIKSRIGLNRICTPYMIVCMVVCFPAENIVYTPYIRCVYSLANPNHVRATLHSGRELQKFSPGHHNNIFQVYALTDSTFLTCAADGQVSGVFKYWDPME